MSAFHRQHPELAGTDRDPWMANEGHRQAHNELVRRGVIDPPETDPEVCEQCDGDGFAASPAERRALVRQGFTHEAATREPCPGCGGSGKQPPRPEESDHA